MHRVGRHLLLLQRRTNATDATVASRARLTREFNGLIIPGHQELQLRQDLTKNRTFSNDPTIEQRRAARLARDAAQQQQPTSLNRANRPRGGQHRGRPATTTPGAGGLDALGQLRVRTNLKTANSRDRRGQPQNRSGSHTAKTRNNGRAVVKRPSTTRSPEDATSQEDISLSVVEEGGEEPYSAEITAPESLSLNLADVLHSRPPKFELRKPSKLNTPRSPTKDRIKYIMETFGGDYTRYAPQTAQDYITTPEKIDATKQAQLALSKNKTIDLNQRETLVRLVAASTAV